MSQSYDVVIIGAGIIGAAIATELSRRGMRTLNIDKNPAAGYGSTSASCAIIRVHYSTLDGTALAYDGYFDWKHWAEYLGVEDERGLTAFHECGCLVMKTASNRHLSNILPNIEALGIPHEHWDAATILERLPPYDLQRYAPAKSLRDEAFGQPTGGSLEGGVFFPTAGYIGDPQLATHNLQRAAEAAGAEFRFSRAVTAIQVQHNRVQGVTLDNGEQIAAGIVINVAGPHSAKINAMVGADQDMSITTQALRQEVVHVPGPEGFDFEHRGIVVSDSDISCYCRPESGNHILVGSEDPECDPREFVDPDDYNREFSEQWTTQALRYAQRMPEISLPSKAQGVVDLYDVTEDWIPIYDRSCIDGYYMAIGTSGNQFKNAVAAGRLMAQLIDYCEAGQDHDQNPLQARCGHLDRSIDMAAFSRKRQINPNSSFSVLG